MITARGTAISTSVHVCMAAVPAPAGFLGRQREFDVLGQLIEGAKRGESGVVVVRGSPGMGKTALIDQVVKSAPEVRVARAVGVESEMELPFAALHQLCAPMLDRLDLLAAPQADALRTVFGLSHGDAPNRFLVGLGVLSLLAELGAEQPLVCVVDDAQWLDDASAQTMAFVARRLLADPVAWLFAVRVDLPVFEGLPELMLTGVDTRSAGALLDSVLPFALDAEVRRRVLAEAGGNPLALLELPRGLSPAQLAGGFAISETVPVADRIAETFRRRLEALPPEARALMLVVVYPVRGAGQALDAV